MYQIASTIGIAEKNKCEYIFPKWGYSGFFKTKIPQLNYGALTIDRIIQEGSNLDYQDIVINDTNKNIELMGYWQSYKYFNHCKNKIKTYFTFREEIIEKNYLGSDEFSYCFIHVRRGDYVNLPNHHPVLEMDYYIKAINKVQEFSFDKSVKFIVCSDDIEWCKNNFIGSQYLFSESDEINDLCKMTLCDYAIIANSSLSWWGAYLGRSENVIAPKKWFGSALPEATKDRFPEGWIIL
jgi:hypothetical protein